MLASCICLSNHTDAQDDTQTNKAERESVIFLTAEPFVFPWVTYSSEQGYQGILYETLAEAAKRANVNLIIKPQPIKRIIKSLLDGLGDFALLPLPLPKNIEEETAFYIYPKPVIHFQLALFGRTDAHPSHTSAVNTETYKVGTQRLISTRLNSLLPNNHHEWAVLHSIPALLKALETKRVDLILTNKNTTIAEATRLGIINHIEVVQELNSLGNYSIAWSHASPTPAQSETARKYVTALDSVTCDGTVDKIIQQFWQRLETQNIYLNNSESFSKAFSVFCPK